MFNERTCLADDEDKLNDEEKALFDDPRNADLFHNPTSNEKRSTEEQPSTSSAKRVKTSANEVSFVILCQIVKKRYFARGLQSVEK